MLLVVVPIFVSLSISKVGTSADLAFTYTNNDTSGQLARGGNTVMQLDGFNNQVNFPVATTSPLPTNTVAKLVWAGDTNLYRSAAGNLKTDGNLTVAGLTPAGVVHNDVFGDLTTSLIVNTDVSSTASISLSKLQIIGPGNILVGNGAGTITPLSMTGQAFINSFGAVTLDNDSVISKTLTNFTPISGAVKSTDSILVAIEKLANSAANPITLSNVGSAPNQQAGVIVGNVLTLEPADQNNPGVVTASLTQTFAGAKVLLGSVTIDNSLTTTGTIQFQHLSTGVLHSDIFGNVTSSQIVDFDVASTASIAVSKLQIIGPANILVGNNSGTITPLAMTGQAFINSFGAVTLDNDSVISKTLTNFVPFTGVVTSTDSILTALEKLAQSAANPITLSNVGSAPNQQAARVSDTVLTLEPADQNNPGVVTASLTQTFAGAKVFLGAVTIDNSLTTTGIVTLPAGSAANPSIQFSGSAGTGFSAPNTDVLSFDADGTEMMTVGCLPEVSCFPKSAIRAHAGHWRLRWNKRRRAL